MWKSLESESQACLYFMVKAIFIAMLEYKLNRIIQKWYKTYIVN